MAFAFSLQVSPQFDVYDASKAISRQESHHPYHQRIVENPLDVLVSFC